MSRAFKVLVPSLAAITLIGGCAHAAARKAPALLPARSLTCDLGRVTNVDTTREQSLNELTFAGQHHLSLFLPAIPVRTSEPPDPAFQETEKVNKKTRITRDPDKITADIIAPFNRVVDLWPERVEMTAPMAAGKSKLLIVTDYDASTGKAKLFMTNARDLLTWDMDKIFAGFCDVAIKPAGPRTGS